MTALEQLLKTDVNELNVGDLIVLKSWMTQHKEVEYIGLIFEQDVKAMQMMQDHFTKEYLSKTNGGEY